MPMAACPPLSAACRTRMACSLQNPYSASIRFFVETAMKTGRTALASLAVLVVVALSAAAIVRLASHPLALQLALK
jgi:hypothetical protein